MARVRFKPRCGHEARVRVRFRVQFKVCLSTCLPVCLSPCLLVCEWIYLSVWVFQQFIHCSSITNIWLECEVLIYAPNILHAYLCQYPVCGGGKVGSRVARWPKALHLSARGVTTVSGLNPGCITSAVIGSLIGPASSGFGRGWSAILNKNLFLTELPS